MNRKLGFGPGSHRPGDAANPGTCPHLIKATCPTSVTLKIGFTTVAQPHKNSVCGDPSQVPGLVASSYTIFKVPSTRLRDRRDLGQREVIAERSVSSLGGLCSVCPTLCASQWLQLFSMGLCPHCGLCRAGPHAAVSQLRVPPCSP